jgi:hypothetical protein
VPEPTLSRRKPPLVEGGGLIGFIFGLVLGFVAGFAGMLFADVHYQLWFAAGCGVVVGVIGFFYGDRFWVWLSEHFGWFH